MKKTWITLVAAALFALTAIAQGNPQEVMKSINDFRAAKMKEARDTGQQVNLAQINEAVKAKALEAIKDVDINKIEAKDAFAWAQIFQLAGKNKEVCDLCTKFLTTNPEPKAKFDAQYMMLSACNAQGEGDMLAMHLPEVSGYDVMSSQQLARMVVGAWISTIQKDKGIDAALKAIDHAEKQVKYESPDEYAKRMLEAAKARAKANPNAAAIDEAKLTEQYKTQGQSTNDSLKFSFVQAKAELLSESNKKSEAVALLDNFIKSQPAGSTIARRASTFKNQLTLVGSLAPSLGIERGYGEFKGLDAYKGKIVILDFFAHWCGPCKAAFPDMKQLYSDLKDKGLEIVGITRYYGYYGQEQGLTPDAEFAKMKDFIAEFGLPWPIMFGSNDNFTNYGVTGIPHVAVIGRDGKVHSMHIGYSKASFVNFRKEIEKMLDEK